MSLILCLSHQSLILWPEEDDDFLTREVDFEDDFEVDEPPPPGTAPNHESCPRYSSLFVCLPYVVPAVVVEESPDKSQNKQGYEGELCFQPALTIVTERPPLHHVASVAHAVTGLPPVHAVTVHRGTTAGMGIVVDDVMCPPAASREATDATTGTRHVIVHGLPQLEDEIHRCHHVGPRAHESAMTRQVDPRWDVSGHHHPVNVEEFP